MIIFWCFPGMYYYFVYFLVQFLTLLLLNSRICWYNLKYLYRLQVCSLPRMDMQASISGCWHHLGMSVCQFDRKFSLINIWLVFIGYFTACVVGGTYDAASYHSPSFGAFRGYTSIHWVRAVVDDTVLYLPSFRKQLTSSLILSLDCLVYLAFILDCDPFVWNYSLS